MKSNLKDLDVLMQKSLYKLNLSVEGAFLKTKIGFLSRTEDDEVVWPRTKDECLQHAMLVLAPCVQGLTGTTRRPGEESIHLKQGDLVVTLADELFIFLGAAKVKVLPVCCC